MDERTQDLIIDAKNGAIAETKLDILITGILATAKKYSYGDGLTFNDTTIDALLMATVPCEYQKKKEELEVNKLKEEE